MYIVLKLVTGILIVLFAIEVLNLYRSLVATGWKTVTGKIINWDMHYKDCGESTSLVVNKLEYSYHVSGKDLKSHRVAFGFPWIIDAEAIGKHIDKVLINAPELKIYYNPDHPEQSTLMVGLKPFHIYKLFFYILIISLAIVASNEL